MTSSVPKVKKFYKWKVGQINIQTCSDDAKLDFALQECCRANLDVICFQEVRRLETDKVKYRGYRFYWMGLRQIAMHGVGIAIRECPDIHTESIMHVSERLIAADTALCSIQYVLDTLEQSLI